MVSARPLREPSEEFIRPKASKKRTLAELEGPVSPEENGDNSNEKDPREEEKKSEETPQCNICTEELIERKAVIDCGHFFCLACIQKWSEIENTCPYCKQEFTKITEKRIRKQ